MADGGAHSAYICYIYIPILILYIGTHNNKSDALNCNNKIDKRLNFGNGYEQRMYRGGYKLGVTNTNYDNIE